MKKKFKITGEEEALYQTKVRETCKGRKDDLAVKAGETVSIIRTTHCPKGKWLARDSNNKYGYILVKSVDLDIQEMMELGKRAKTSSTPNSNGFIDPEVTSAGSRSSHPYALHQESFTDDSEEWCDDDDDTVFTPTDNIDLQLNQRVSSLDVVSQKPNPALQGQIDTNDKTRQEALQKLASFFAQPKTPDHATLKRNTIIEEAEPEESVSEDKQDVDLQILPPPDLYADIVVGES
ncbi:FYN-binding protein 1 isoform X1 [Pygocentrus nattereri]|uniref:FYN-binding protein 1 isoform X1 n=1 Tax=Pygocentrus nattereri TaxID=42514 RepID=UPI000814AA36|nr:FYN-binding protein 1 isoform X1 [Pygocentrus nattereri]